MSEWKPLVNASLLPRRFTLMLYHRGGGLALVRVRNGGAEYLRRLGTTEPMDLTGWTHYCVVTPPAKEPAAC